MRNLLLIAVLMLMGLNAYAGIDKGNGGDICESKIVNITKNFKQWLNNENFSEVKLPTSIKGEDYKNRMLEAINKSEFSCSTEILKINESEKTCINYTDSGKVKVNCNYNRFMNLTATEQYRLIHHELAGVSGFEKNNAQEKSNYELSNQLTDNVIKNHIYIKDGYVIPDINFNIISSCGLEIERQFIKKDQAIEQAFIYEVLYKGETVSVVTVRWDIPGGNAADETIVENQTCKVLKTSTVWSD